MNRNEKVGDSIPPFLNNLTSLHMKEILFEKSVGKCRFVSGRNCQTWSFFDSLMKRTIPSIPKGEVFVAWIFSSVASQKLNYSFTTGIGWVR